MKLKRYKPLFLQAGILLFIIAIFIFILEQQKQFINIDFSKQYGKNKTVELAGFEEGESWKGNYSYDSKRTLEGKSSITLSSWYGTKNSISKEGMFKLSNGYSKGYISLFIPNAQDLAMIHILELELFDSRDNKKNYDLTQLLHTGWNRVPVIIPSWGALSSVSFTLTSQVGAIAEVNLDRFWVENTSLYAADIFHTTSSSLSLRTIGERTYLYSVSPDGEPYTIPSPSSIKRGSILISLIPEHAQRAELSVNNTAMKIQGTGMDTCILSTASVDAPPKKMSTTSGKDNLYVFLKAEIMGKKVKYSLSNNGIDFEVCGEVEGRGGPIKLILQGSYLIDAYSVEY